MAMEYRLYGAADMTTEEIFSFMADAIDGSVSPEGFAQREGMTVTAYRVDSGEEASAAGLFGFPHHVTATFRFSNTAPSQVRERNTALMIEAVLRFFDRYPGDGVLLFNGEEVVLQRLAGDLALDRDWEDWTDVPGMSEVIAGREQRLLPQPLL
ncbi:hypothetical protein HC028_21095 [Planosporangium flavigriseum]|uniref:Uncharacterized protein n=1 Tax=Planosporangium flavigriseum TaxID=373681 RepID=A0A8J3PMK4_9ACTN|nr:SitI3 family protein [Planosporangium flavigriseum]NJC66981.1 hypothetical protein [Planosporangium flavigriseum]GIG73953.1 hypothetical protein Pfl04_23570 [Planosporangium flavigriseum]